MTFKEIYSNFDGLDIAFQGVLPEEVLAELAKAKELAQQNRDDAIIEINGIKLRVAESGGSGGYAFRFDTGEDGAVWFVKNTNNAKDWALRVSVKSLTFAIHGFDKAKNDILETLRCLGAYSADRRCLETGKTTDFPLESISRVDYCIDFETPHFQPNVNHIVTHARATKRSHQKVDISCVERGDGIESILIGKMPNKQIAIYDKLAEIKTKQKLYWWKIWKLNAKEFTDEIWRVEVRAGKKELERWGIKTFAQLEEKAGNVFTDMLKSIRYAELNPYDSNKSRWNNHELWQAASHIIESGLQRFTSNTAVRDGIMLGIRAEKTSQIKKQIDGLVITLATLLNIDVDDLILILEEHIKRMKEKLFANRGELEEKHTRARQKYSMYY